MPNRYEREIEEILRNLEQTEPKPGRGQKSGSRSRRMPNPRPRPGQRVQLAIHFTAAEWLLLAAVVLALVAGGYAAYTRVPNLTTGILAAIGIVCLLLVAGSQFLLRPRARPATRYGNITAMKRGPFNTLKTQWHLFLLKLRYRRRTGR